MANHDAALNTRRGSRHRTAMVTAIALLAVGGVAACGGDDDEVSDQDRYCAAGDELRTSMQDLAAVDIVAEGRDALDAALEDIDAAAAELRETADEVASPEVERLNAAVDDVEEALLVLGEDITADNASAVVSAVQNALNAAAGVYDTLSDCE